MLSTFDLITSLIVLAAIFAWINETVVKLPHSIGLLVMGLAASLVLIGVDLVVPQVGLYEKFASTIRQVDFQQTVLSGMLAFLLFAGALHVNWSDLKGRALPVALMASVGVVISTAVIGTGLWTASNLLGLGLSLGWSLVFGALISPTDPVAVLSTLKTLRVPKTLETDMAGESLFNDGVGVVLFTVMLAVVASGSFDTSSLAQVGRLFFVDALGGALLGLATGYLAYRGMRRIDNYPTETLVSLALVTGTYAVAAKLHMSGPIAVVVAGIFVGNRGPLDAMSDVTKQYLFSFWTLVDEMLNSVLFLLIGLEVVVVRFDPSFAWIIVLSIPLVLVARFIAVSVPALMFRSHYMLVPGMTKIMTWGGLRGGISIALALSIPDVPQQPVLLAATYAVVVFSVVVQGLTLRALITRVITPASLH